MRLNGRRISTASGKVYYIVAFFRALFQGNNQAWKEVSVSEAAELLKRRLQKQQGLGTRLGREIF